jgi:hypothetical protein
MNVLQGELSVRQKGSNLGKRRTQRFSLPVYARLDAQRKKPVTFAKAVVKNGALSSRAKPRDLRLLFATLRTKLYPLATRLKANFQPSSNPAQQS